MRSCSSLPKRRNKNYYINSIIINSLSTHLDPRSNYYEFLTWLLANRYRKTQHTHTCHSLSLLWLDFLLLLLLLRGRRQQRGLWIIIIIMMWKKWESGKDPFKVNDIKTHFMRIVVVVVISCECLISCNVTIDNSLRLMKVDVRWLWAALMEVAKLNVVIMIVMTENCSDFWLFLGNYFEVSFEAIFFCKYYKVLNFFLIKLIKVLRKIIF